MIFLRKHRLYWRILFDKVVLVQFMLFLHHNLSNGAAGLLGKDERIYAQFPVRIALQNTVSESYALFGIGNDAAAQLRVRGEAVINENYGDQDSNQKFTVAYAEPEETRKIRQSFCKEYDKWYPVIFTRQDYMDFSMIIPEIKKWRNSIKESGIIHVPVGVRLSVERDIISIPFMNEMGRNTLLFLDQQKTYIKREAFLAKAISLLEWCKVFVLRLHCNTLTAMQDLFLLMV